MQPAAGTAALLARVQHQWNAVRAATQCENAQRLRYKRKSIVGFRVILT
jgi:hypothetical protein